MMGFIGYAFVNLILPFLGFEKNGPVVVSGAMQRQTFKASVKELVSKLDPLNAEFAVSMTIPADRIDPQSLCATKNGIRDLKLTDSVVPFTAELLDGHHRQEALLETLFPKGGERSLFIKFCERKKANSPFTPKERKKWDSWVERLREQGRWVAAIYDKGEYSRFI